MNRGHLATSYRAGESDRVGWALTLPLFSIKTNKQKKEEEKKLAPLLLEYLREAACVHTLALTSANSYHGQLLAFCRSIARFPQFFTQTIGFYVSKAFFWQDVDRIEFFPQINTLYF